MNTVTQAERARLVALAKQAITLDAANEIVDGFEPAWRTFATEHGISNQRARSYVSRAARLLRGEMAKPGPGRPATLEPGAPITVWLMPAHVRTARLAGAGNVSAGVRTALEDWKPVFDPGPGETVIISDGWARIQPAQTGEE